jgi:hypothetical protein
MHIEKEEDGVWLRDLPVWVVDTLLCLPEWIESDNEDVRARLLPRAYYDDEEQEREWRDALGSSLEHLFASRTEIVRKDLGQMEVDVSEVELTGEAEEDQLQFVTQTLFHVWIPGPHLSAWVSTLQAGTHALFILEGLTAEDVSKESVDEIEPEKQLSMMRLAVLQEILVRLLDD